jgi:hypothetical protein
MLRAWLASVLALVALLATTRLAHADEPDPTRAGRGFAVVAADGATDAAWPLAQRVYRSAVLRPVAIDDARARVLAGEAAPPLAPPELTELAELRAGIKGDDAASREVLAALAEKLGVHAIIVVFGKQEAEGPSARVYVVGIRAFDAARYNPDVASNSSTIAWDGAIRSLERPYLPQPQPLGVIARVPPVKPKASESKAFYESPWFWVAVGTAALVAGGVLIATNIQTNDTIHLQVRLP